VAVERGARRSDRGRHRVASPSVAEETIVTDDIERLPTDELDPAVPPRTSGPDAGGPDQPDKVGPETDVPTRDDVLEREGADAPDAADIENPERQL
jgi:hypothetical protein